MRSCVSVWQRPARWAGAALLALLTLTLGGCGGSIFLGFGGDDDRPPEVSLAVSPEAARRGEAVRLVAAASDDFRVDSVAFYRVDGAVASLLDSDTGRPYQHDTVLPSTAGSSVQFFARATDDSGQSRDSNLVTVTVLP